MFDTQWADLLIPVNTIQDKAAIIKQLDRIVPCEKFIQLSEDEQAKVLRDARIEDVDCKKVMDALPSDCPLLKGADYIIVESAKSLGLPVYIKPFLSNNRNDGNFCYALKYFSQGFVKYYKHIESFQNDFRLLFDDALEQNRKVDTLQMFGNVLSRFKTQDIIWCQKLLHHQLAGATNCRHDGISSLDLWYKSAAILIKIPKWSEFCQKLVAISTGESCRITGTEDGTENDFKDIIQDDVVHGELQELDKQIQVFICNKYIHAVEGLVDVLKSIQIKVNGCLNNPIEFIYHLKRDLKVLEDHLKSDFFGQMLVDLGNTKEQLKHKYVLF